MNKVVKTLVLAGLMIGMQPAAKAIDWKDAKEKAKAFFGNKYTKIAVGTLGAGLAIAGVYNLMKNTEIVGIIRGAVGNHSPEVYTEIRNTFKDTVSSMRYSSLATATGLGFMTWAWLTSKNTADKKDDTADKKDDTAPTPQPLKFSFKSHELGLPCSEAHAQGRRSSMEDAWIATSLEKGEFFAVYDGHGGDKVAEKAADKTTGLHAFFAQKLKDSKDPKKAFEKVFPEYNKREFSDAMRTGSTAIAAYIKENKVWFAVLADSRALIIRDNKVIFSTAKFEHKPSNPEEMARIKAAGGEVFRGRVSGALAVSRALGDSGFTGVIAEPTVIEHSLKSGDIIALYCDGIHDVIEDDQVPAILSSSTLPGKDAADRLVQKALADGTTDNVSVIIIQIP